MKFAESRFPENDNISSSVTSDNNLVLYNRLQYGVKIFLPFFLKH